MADVATGRVLRIDPRAHDRREKYGRASFTASSRSPATLAVLVEGDVDATNHQALVQYVEGRLPGSFCLDLDLRLTDFFGTAGVGALHNIKAICDRYGATFVLRGGRQLRRLMAICDPDRRLPIEVAQSVLDDVHAGARNRQLFIGGNN